MPQAVGCPDVLRLLVMLVGAAALASLSVSLVLLLWTSSSLPASLVVALVSCLRLLMAGIELVANAAVLHARADDVREPVVVSLDLERVGDDRLDPIVVAHDLHLIDDPES